MRRRTDMRAMTGSVFVLAVLTAGGCMLPSLERPADASSDAASAPDAFSQGSSAPDSSSDRASAPDAESDTGGSPSGPSDSPDDAGNSSDGTADDTPSFNEVKQLVVQDCAGCHNADGIGSSSNFVFPTENPSDAEFLDGLQGTAATPSETPLLSEGEPDNSAVYLRTQPDPEWAEREMPTGDGWQGDPEESETTLKRWIAGGAPSPDPSNL